MLQHFRHVLSRHSAVVIAMAVVLAAGFILRMWHLGEQSLWIDEGFTLNAALATLENGYPRLASHDVYWHNIIPTFLSAGIIKLAGLNPWSPWAVRLPSLFTGLAVIVAAFILSKRLFSSSAMALLVAGLVAFSYWEIDWSRQVRGYIGLQLFIVTASVYLCQWLESRRIRHLLFFAGSFSLAYLHHALAVVFLPGFGVAMLSYHILHPQGVRREHVVIGVLLLATISLAAVQFRLVPFGLSTYDYSAHYLGFLFDGLAPVTFAALAGIGLGIFDRKRFWPVMFTAILVLFPLAIIMLFGKTANLRYLFPLFPFMVILAVYAVVRIAEFMPVRRTLFVWVGTAGTVLILFFSQMAFIPQYFYQTEFDSPRPDFKSAYSLIRESMEENDVVLSPYAHLTNIYLGQTGYWLPISLNGIPNQRQIVTDDGTFDHYVRAPAVLDNDLETFLDEHHGFIVIDGMARVRLGHRLTVIVEHPKISEILHGGEGLNEITVYRF